MLWGYCYFFVMLFGGVKKLFLGSEGDEKGKLRS